MFNPRWPSQPNNDLAPWYTIALRAVVALAYFPTLVLLVSLLRLGWGAAESRRVWKCAVIR